MYWKVELYYIIKKVIHKLSWYNPTIKTYDNYYILIYFDLHLNFSLTHWLPMHPFFTPLKTPENLTVFWCFQGGEKGCIGNEWVKPGLLMENKGAREAMKRLRFHIFWVIPRSPQKEKEISRKIVNFLLRWFI